ncbi:MAG: hypothetical protein C0625_03200 [Arcobacter sp.]|nr:MAG: hypothetical protein C0625_03200 [Arcobacter sp.]
MKKLFFLFLGIFSFSNAEYQIERNKNLFIVKVSNTSFENSLLNLKDELTFNGFTIVYELDMAKSTNTVAKLLERKTSLEKGINIGICKSSFTFKMVSENFLNINYCPLAISIYSQNKNTTFISFKYYKTFKFGDKIAEEINETLKTLIIDSIE